MTPAPLHIPSRVGVEETPELVCRVLVTLDGDPLRYVTRADTSEGWVEVLCRDDRGYVLTPDRRDVARKRLFGAVRVLPR